MNNAQRCVRKIADAADVIIIDYFSKGEYDKAARSWMQTLMQTGYDALSREIRGLHCGYLFSDYVAEFTTELARGADGDIESAYRMLRFSAGRTQLPSGKEITIPGRKSR